ncbi:MAG TPA: 2-hydroxyacid dehydrogenase [Thermoplasmata archaeon]|nr:2-hydroxyacid dehydrogenase [Thermoplasmata archaeon]
MTSRPPRLLLAVRPRATLADEVSRALPDIGAVPLGEATPEDLDGVEAVLLGSVARDAKSWDPAASPKLRFVQRIFTGVDDLPFDRFPPDVAIAGNVGGYAPFVAEHAIALALGAARSLLPAHAQTAAGRLRPAPQNRVLWRQTAVILGYGAIGGAIAARLRGFEMRIVGVNRTGASAPGCDTMFPADRLREAVAVGDFVFDARPLTRATRGSLGAAELAAMPPKAVYVNVGRAGTVDESALYQHLVQHPEFRAAMDVWWEEGFADGSVRFRFPFLTLPNVLGTPHSAGYAPPVEAYALSTALDNLRRFFSGQTPRHLVDRTEYSPGR